MCGMRVRLGAPAEQQMLPTGTHEELLLVECGVRDSSSGSEVLRADSGQHQDSVNDAYSGFGRVDRSLSSRY